MTRKKPIKKYRSLVIQRVASVITDATSSQVSTEKDWLKDGFQPLEPDIEDFLAESPPGAIRDTHYIAIALFVALVIAASFVKNDIIISGAGRLAADAPPIVVQPLQLSVIHDIRVKVGDVVHKGDIIATLDSTFTQADKISLAKQRASLSAEVARVEAEVSHKPLMLKEDMPENQLQMTLYRQRLSQYNAKLDDFDQKLQRYRSDMRSSEENNASLSKQLGVAKEVEQMRSSLYQTRIGSRINMLDAQSTRLRTERELEEGTGHIDDIRHDIKSTQADREAFIDGWNRELLENLVKLRAELASVSDSYTKASRMNDLVILTAPEDGMVMDIAKRSVGSVLHEAEPLVTLIPINSQLIADITINSGEVGYVKIGDPVEVKIDAFPYQRHGLLHGIVRSISEESAPGGGPTQANSPQSQSPAGIYHHSEIVFTDMKLRNLPPGAHLIPGMTLSAGIKVGDRRVISYFLYPITRSMDESIKEP